jgi:PAS domain S-box-containing protein
MALGLQSPWQANRHEIVMSIGNSLDLQAMLEETLAVFLRALDCRSIGVLETVEASRFSTVYCLPQDASGFDATAQDLANSIAQDPHQDPLSQPVAIRDGQHFYAWPLPDYGLLLLSRSAPLPLEIIQDLTPIANKLARAIRTCLHCKAAQSERQQQAKDEQRWLMALEGAGHGVWDWDINANTVFISPTWKSMLGYAEEEVGNQLTDWSDRVHPEDLPACFAEINKHLRGETPAYRHDYRIRTKAGAYLWVSDHGRALRDDHNQPTRMIGTLVDISDYIEQERALRAAQQVADTANKAKHAFLATMGHELRTPMNAIMGFTDLTLDTTLNDTQRKYLGHTKAASTQLLVILNDILDFSSMEAGGLSLHHQDCPLNEPLEMMVTGLASLAEQKQIALSLEWGNDIPACIHIDLLRLRQVLVNLLSNAIKFTKTGSVCLRVDRLHGQPHDQLRFSVQDTGIGLSEEQQTRLFSAFTQIDDSVSRRYEGIGLGLAISARLATLLGGHIALTSVLGAGSTFSLVLPYVPCHTPDV